MKKVKPVSTTPKDIPTDIVRDFPGRFYATASDLRRLVIEIEQMLHIENKEKKVINFWVRLENGTLYHTDDLEIVLKDENENSKINRTRIMLLIVIADLIGENDDVITRIVVEFIRAKVNNPGSYSWEYIQDETFNLNYHGVSYRVKDRNRQSAMSIIEKLESRVKKFRRWYSDFPRYIESLRKLLVQDLYFFLYGLFCFASAFYLEHFHSPLPIYFSSFVHDLLAASSLALLTIGAFLLSFIVFTLTLIWIAPPTFIEIGDEIKEYQTNLRIKEFILGTVVLGIILGIISGVLQDLLMSIILPRRGSGG